MQETVNMTHHETQRTEKDSQNKKKMLSYENANLLQIH
jgi:hypothetical protein